MPSACLVSSFIDLDLSSYSTSRCLLQLPPHFLLLEQAPKDFRFDFCPFPCFLSPRPFDRRRSESQTRSSRLDPDSHDPSIRRFASFISPGEAGRSSGCCWNWTGQEWEQWRQRQGKSALLGVLADERVTGWSQGWETIPRAFQPESVQLQRGQSSVPHSPFRSRDDANSLYNTQASVNVHGRDKPILLAGLESMNRSVAGDLVVVELLPESQWKSIGEEVVDSDQKQDDPDALPTTTDDTQVSKPTDSAASIVPNPPASTREVQPTGKVVGIIRRAFRPYVCTLDLASLPPSALTSSTSTTILASPVSRQIPRIRILTRQAAHLSSQKFLVSIDRWSITSRYPEGHFVRILGQVGSKEGEVESLLEEWEVPYRPFSSSILNCLPEEGEGWVVPSKDNDPKGIWKNREDLRDEIICSIDPPGCTDIDDALHAKLLPNGNIQAGVREFCLPLFLVPRRVTKLTFWRRPRTDIADVSHFVLPDNPMDAEAASRGTTVYLVDKRIDMLPHLLGTNLCSLRPYVERLAFSVIWVSFDFPQSTGETSTDCSKIDKQELNENADIVNVRFTKSVIASKEAFTYEAAQKTHDDP